MRVRVVSLVHFAECECAECRMSICRMMLILAWFVRLRLARAATGGCRVSSVFDVRCWVDIGFLMLVHVAVYIHATADDGDAICNML